jgi:hypothetical protein
VGEPETDTTGDGDELDCIGVVAAELGDVACAAGVDVATPADESPPLPRAPHAATARVSPQTVKAINVICVERDVFMHFTTDGGRYGLGTNRFRGVRNEA